MGGIAMIEESYVSFDTARMLKEAGFEAECGFIVDDDGRKLYRPTQALAARWLREKHNLHIWCELTQYRDWFYCIDKIKPYKQYVAVSEADFRSLEAALEAGLQEAIKLIKK